MFWNGKNIKYYFTKNAHRSLFFSYSKIFEYLDQNSFVKDFYFQILCNNSKLNICLFTPKYWFTNAFCGMKIGTNFGL